MDEKDFTNWLNEIYQHDSNYFTVDFKGKKMVFTSMYAMEDLNKAMSEKSDENKGYAMIALLSHNPKISFEQAKRLPGPLVEEIQDVFEENLKLFKKKS